MSEDSGFKILITNQSKKDRTIRLVIAIILILVNLVAASSMSQLLSMITLGVAGVLIFNTISGNCYIYRMLGINTWIKYLLFQRIKITYVREVEWASNLKEE